MVLIKSGPDETFDSSIIKMTEEESSSTLPRNRLVSLAVAMTVASLSCCLHPSTSFAPSVSSSSSSSIIRPRRYSGYHDMPLVMLYAAKKKKHTQKNNKKKVEKKGFGNNLQDEPVVESVPASQRPESSSAQVVAQLNALINLKNTTETDTEKDNKMNNKNEGTKLLSKRYREEFKYEQEKAQDKKSNRHQLVQISESPLIFTIEEFIDPEACRRVQNDASGCFDLMYPELLSDKLFNGQESEMDGLLFNLASSDDHAASNDPYPDGLHMDTNNRCLHRHVTCILYLNDIPEECGGATVFPLARTLPNDPALHASQRLLDAKISHTRQQIPQREQQSDARLLESRLPMQSDYLENPKTSTVIRIQPKAGKLLVFFSRDENGHDDPRAWHAGERIKRNGENQVTEKRILTLFKEVHYDNDDNSRAKTPLEAYLAPMVDEQRTWLKAKAKLQRAILEKSSS